MGGPRCLQRDAARIRDCRDGDGGADFASVSWDSALLLLGVPDVSVAWRAWMRNIALGSVQGGRDVHASGLVASMHCARLAMPRLYLPVVDACGKCVQKSGETTALSADSGGQC